MEGVWKTFVVSEHAGGRRTAGPKRAVLGSGKPESDPARESDGVGAQWDWDGRRLWAKSDPYGFCPLFYHASSERFAIGNSIRDLLSHGVPATIDDLAMSAFLRLGFFLGDDTPFSSIRAVPPGARLVWEGGRLDLESDPAGTGASAPPPGRDAAIQIYGELFQSAIDGMAPPEEEKTAVPLSGGRDSRHILLALQRSGRVPDSCVTVRSVPPQADEDAAVARLLTRAMDVPHVVLDPPHRYVSADRLKNLLTHFCADEHTWILPLPDHLSREGYSVAFDGIAGGVLAGGAFMNEDRLRRYEQEDLAPLAEDLLGPEGYLPMILPPDMYRRWSRDQAVAATVEELERYRHAPNPIGQFFFWTRTRREIALSTWGIVGTACNMVAPYLHPEVYAFLASLPAHYFLEGPPDMQKPFHTQTIARHYPRYAHIRYERPNAPRRRLSLHRKTARYVGEVVLGTFAPSHRSSYVRRRFIFPRALRALLSPEYGTGIPQVFDRVIYLQQLEEAQRDGGRTRDRAEVERRPNTDRRRAEAPVDLPVPGEFETPTHPTSGTR